MNDVVTVWLQTAEKTAAAGSMLAQSLYAPQTAILLHGNVGLGKSTFIRGLAGQLGITEPVVSPTFDLEQRYHLPSGNLFVHLDLYRLTPAEAATMIHAAEGIAEVLCIEWADRLTTVTIPPPRIVIELQEKRDGREARITYDDLPIPTKTHIAHWRREARLPAHVIAHCEGVASVCTRIADHLIAQGVPVRTSAVAAAAKLHDLLRFVDFHEDAGPNDGQTDNDTRIWQSWKTRFPGMRHEQACAAFLRAEGFPEIATIVEPHGLTLPSLERTRLEQMILFYADKRVKMDEFVSLDE